MKRFFLIAALLLTMTGFIFGQAKEEQAVRRTLDEIASALKAKDVAALGGFYAPDYTFVNTTGVMFDKAQRLAAIAAGKPFESFAYENMKIRTYGNTAVVNTNAKTKVADEDARKAALTMTLVKNNGKWQVVAAQISPITAASTATMQKKE